MFSWIYRTTLQRALKACLKRRAPAQFSFSHTLNYFSPHLAHPESGVEVLVDALSEKAVQGRVWNGEKFDYEFSIPLTWLQDWALEVNRFYGYDRLLYRGVLEFYKSELCLTPQRRWLWDRFSQKLYNYRTRFLEDQISVLKGIINLHLRSAPKQTPILHQPVNLSVIQLFSELYGQRIYNHPRYEEESAKFRLLIEALAANGDLVKVGQSDFKLSPAALNTINNFENEERRHRDSKNFNRVMIILTAVLAISGILNTCDKNKKPTSPPKTQLPEL